MSSPVVAGRGAAREYGDGESGWINYDITDVRILNNKDTKGKE